MSTKGRFKIQDEFTDMKKADGTPMSRQQIHMLRKRARGLCWICSEKAIPGGYFCVEHQIQARERMRRKLGCRRCNAKAASYVMEEKLKKRAKTKTKKAAAKGKSAKSKK